MTTVKIQHSHGQTESITVDGSPTDALNDALDLLRDVYGRDIEHEGDLAEGRVLVWQDEAAAENDDGARAVASIRLTH